MEGITTSLSSFRQFIEYDALYVDKTMYIHRLVQDRKRNFFFLSRPRRCGKSLFCSTLHALFDGRKDLFKGLFIAEKTDYSFEKYPVIHLNFALIPTRSADTFMASLTRDLQQAAADNSVKIKECEDPAEMLKRLLHVLHKSNSKGAVIIIDEFDAPLTGISDTSDAAVIRRVLNDFYSTIKNCNEYIRFFFMTGVVKLSNLSIFSKMNNLTDISMDPKFAAAFGYTEEEMLDYFGKGIDEIYESSREKYGSREGLVKKIREYYYGYRFSPRSDEKVYNPVSIGFFFSEEGYFANYWNMTGASTLAVDLAARIQLEDTVNESLMLPVSAFSTFDISQIYTSNLSRESILALLYYTGYLTIRESDEEIITLGFPNTEIAMSFTVSLVSRYRNRNAENVEVWLSRMIKAANHGNSAQLMNLIGEYFAAFSYELADRNPERTYQTIFHAIFVMAGLYAISEDRGLRGRADEALMTGDHIWIFELKIDRSAEEALRQIQTKGYEEKYAYLMKPGKTLHEIGISFSSSEKKITEYKEEIQNR